jgi:DNA invertase Pin-like site-specific DNA recombinase
MVAPTESTEVKRRAAIYLRKSTTGTDEDGGERQEGSYERQLAAIEDYAKRHSIRIVRRYEEPVSGKSMRKRKVFKRMVEDAKSPGCPFNIIIFGEYDRFMRDVKEAMRYEVELDDAGVELHFTNLKNDGSMGDVIHKSIVRPMAAEYIRELARKVTQGMVRKASKGSWLGGVPPYGYRKEKGLDAIIRLLIYEEEAAVVREIFALSAQGYGHMHIAKVLNMRGVPSGIAARARKSKNNRNPDGRWSGQTVRMMLRNPVYKGVYAWNRKARVDCFDWKLEGNGTIDIGKNRASLSCFKRGKDGVYVDRQKPREDWIVCENGAVPGIVSAELFDQVQQRFALCSRKSWRTPNMRRYLMSGALTCSCGNGFNGQPYTKRLKTTGKEETYAYYRCAGDKRKGTHADGTVRPMLKAESIDEVVVRGIASRIEMLSDINNVEHLVVDRLNDFMRGRSSRLPHVESELRKVVIEGDRLAEVYAKLGRAISDEKIQDLRDRENALRKERESLITAGESVVEFDIKSEVRRYVEKIQSFRGLLDSGDSSDKIQVREFFLKGADVEWPGDGGFPRINYHWWDMPRVCADEKGSPPPKIPGNGLPYGPSRSEGKVLAHWCKDNSLHLHGFISYKISSAQGYSAK